VRYFDYCLIDHQDLQTGTKEAWPVTGSDTSMTERTICAHSAPGTPIGFGDPL
jgi:hypothetical protein